MYKDNIDINLSEINRGKIELRVEKKLKFIQPPKNVYDIVIGGKISPRWNPTLAEVVEKEENIDKKQFKLDP